VEGDGLLVIARRFDEDVREPLASYWAGRSEILALKVGTEK